MTPTTGRVAYPSGPRHFSTKRFRVLIALVIFAEAAFGTYYVWTEFHKGAHFNPFLSAAEFRAQVVDPAAKADIPGGDIEAYVKAASSIANRGNYTLESGLPSAWVTPGYPVALAGAFRIFGFRYASVLFVNIVAWAFALLAFASIADSLGFSISEKILTLAFFASNLRMSMFIGYTYTECLFLGLITSFLAVYLKVIRSTEHSINFRLPVALGLLAGLGALVRPVFLGVAVPLLIIGPFIRSRKIKLVPREVAGWLLAFVLMIAPMGGWIFRNSQALGDPLISTSSALARAEGSQDFYLTRPLVGIFPAATRQFPFDFPVAGTFHPHPELNVFLAAKAWTERWNAEHSFADRRHLLIQRIVALFSPFIEAMSPRNRDISLIYWLFLSPLSLIGIYRLRHALAAWVLFAASFLLTLLPSLVVVGTSLRYQIPGQVLLAPLAAAGFTTILRWKTKVPA